MYAVPSCCLVRRPPVRSPHFAGRHALPAEPGCMHKRDWKKLRDGANEPTSKCGSAPDRDAPRLERGLFRTCGSRVYRPEQSARCCATADIPAKNAGDPRSGSVYCTASEELAVIRGRSLRSSRYLNVVLFGVVGTIFPPSERDATQLSGSPWHGAWRFPPPSHYSTQPPGFDALRPSFGKRHARN